MADTKHLDFLDNAKGIGIFLVIMGHTMFPLHAAIDVFHMPLFFLLAGMTIRKYADVTSFVVNKINRIMIPYLFFFTLWALINFFYPLLGDYVGPLWFLPTLFATLMLCQVLINFEHQGYTIGIVVLCIVLTFFINCYNKVLLPFDLDRMLRAIAYMYVGYLFRNSVCFNIFVVAKPAKSIAALMALISVYACGLVMMLNRNELVEARGFMTGEMYGRSVLLIYLTSFAAIFATLFVSRLVGKAKLLSWLGTNSMTILCVHFPFTQAWNQFISSTSIYQYGGGKIACALLSYIVIIVFCIPWIYFCKRYVPKLTGYIKLLN